MNQSQKYRLNCCCAQHNGLLRNLNAQHLCLVICHHIMNHYRLLIIMIIPLSTKFHSIDVSSCTIEDDTNYLTCTTPSPIKIIAPDPESRNDSTIQLKAGGNFIIRGQDGYLKGTDETQFQPFQQFHSTHDNNYIKLKLPSSNQQSFCAFVPRDNKYFVKCESSLEYATNFEITNNNRQWVDQWPNDLLHELIAQDNEHQHNQYQDPDPYIHVPQHQDPDPYIHVPQHQDPLPNINGAYPFPIIHSPV